MIDNVMHGLVPSIEEAGNEVASFPGRYGLGTRLGMKLL